MKKIISIIFIFATITAFGQTKTPENFGFKHIVYEYKTDKVDILIKSKKAKKMLKSHFSFFVKVACPSL